MRFVAWPAAIILCSMAAWGADPSVPIVVSATSPRVGITPDSLASIFGEQLSTTTASATGLPWPTSLGDISVVYVVDSQSQTAMASLLYVSPTQMNIWIPPGVAPGPATIKFPFTGLPPGVGTAALRTIPVTLEKVAPGIFSANGSGSGVAAATALRVALPTQFQSQIPVFTCVVSECVAIPLDVGVDAPVYLTLYGSGIRGASSVDNIKVTIGGTDLKPTYAGPQPQIPGLDQINVGLPLSLRGSGVVNVTVTVDGVPSNTVQVAIQ
jgi:uncharacterized protein (TIGR03437 family)